MVKFNALSETNQKYIMAIQQALAFAQANSTDEQDKPVKRKVKNNEGVET